MKKITFGLIWLVSFLLLLLVCDQFLLRYPGADTPFLNDFQRFYRDLRQRVISMEYGGQPHGGQHTRTVEQVIVRRTKKTVLPSMHQVAAEVEATRYIYVDEQNTLNFADRLEDIPLKLRGSAHKLDK